MNRLSLDARALRGLASLGQVSASPLTPDRPRTRTRSSPRSHPTFPERQPSIPAVRPHASQGQTSCSPRSEVMLPEVTNSIPTVRPDRPHGHAVDPHGQTPDRFAICSHRAHGKSSPQVTWIQRHARTHISERWGCTGLSAMADGCDLDRPWVGVPSRACCAAAARGSLQQGRRVCVRSPARGTTSASMSHQSRPRVCAVMPTGETAIGCRCDRDRRRVRGVADRMLARRDQTLTLRDRHR